jgi:signal peptidase I
VDPSKGYIKRAIGLPGEAIEIRDGEVWIDGIRLAEPYVDSRFNQAKGLRKRVVVPPTAYFVLGDNRDNSSDSRSWGFVPQDLIFAKVISP